MLESISPDKASGRAIFQSYSPLHVLSMGLHKFNWQDVSTWNGCIMIYNAVITAVYIIIIVSNTDSALKPALSLLLYRHVTVPIINLERAWSSIRPTSGVFNYVRQRPESCVNVALRNYSDIHIFIVYHTCRYVNLRMDTAHQWIKWCNQPSFARRRRANRLDEVMGSVELHTVGNVESLNRTPHYLKQIRCFWHPSTPLL